MKRGMGYALAFYCVLLASCGAEAGGLNLPGESDEQDTVAPERSPTPAPSTSTPELTGPLATVAALNAQITLDLPTSPPRSTSTSTLDPLATPTATPVRGIDSLYSTIDRPDDTDLHQIHFIYAIPSDGIDRLRDVNGEIELSANATNYYLEQQTGGTSLRYDTFNGELDITFLKLPYTADELSALGTQIVSGFDQLIRDFGFKTQNKIYFVYYDGLHVLTGGERACGVAIRPPSDWGVTGTLFLQGYSSDLEGITCPQPTKTEDLAGWLELVMLHEIFHVLGAVQECATNYSNGHVNDNEFDLMSPSFNPNFRASNTLDINNDDYFMHDIPGCPDVADSVFLDLLPENAEEPPSWSLASGRRAFNPFDLLATLEAQ